MNKACSLIAVTLVLISSQQNCLAVDFDPTHAATSVQGAGGDNSVEVNRAIQQANISANSKKVEAIYQNGSIVLRGTVDSDRDRQTIDNAAEKCGCVSIKNEIVVNKNPKRNSKTKTYTPQPQAEILTPSHKVEC